MKTNGEKVLKKEISFEFFVEGIELDIPYGIRDARFMPQNQKGIKNFFDAVVVLGYATLIEDIQKISTNLNLNDWGKYLLIKKISEKIFASQDNARLLSGFIFNKLGYSIRVGLSKKHILLMFESKKSIYSTAFYKINNKNFYSLSNYAKSKVSEVFTYTNDYSSSDKPLDLSLKTLPNFKNSVKTKVLSFKIDAKSYSVNYKYNQNLIDFMSTYPQANYETFFNAPLDPQSYNSIVNDLRKHINGKRTSLAISFVLHFVQNSFEYEVDLDQFSKEKIMFAQETLYFKKSDSEDRVILFAYLVKELFGISVVGVKYSNHLSTALYIPMDGDTVDLFSKRYVIADPTYINASIGQNITSYKSVKPDSFIYIGDIKR